LKVWLYTSFLSVNLCQNSVNNCCFWFCWTKRFLAYSELPLYFSLFIGGFKI